MFRVTLIVTAFLLTFSQSSILAQTLNDCSNLGFETGSLQGWTGIYGNWTADFANDSILILSEAYGLDSWRHRVHHAGEGNVPEVTQEAIPLVPPGSEYAVQLGNSINGAEYERLRTSFLVDSANTLFQYQFAVIFEDPNHVPLEQPKFELIVWDDQGNVLPCGFYQVTSAGNIDGFKSEGNIRYRNWTTAGIDLRSYVGRVVTVQISTYDCSQGGHWGMALFDASCFSAGITPVNFCPGVDKQITLEAPQGFQNYKWSTGQNTRVVTIQNPKAGDEVSVEFSPYSTLSDDCRLFLSFKIPAYVDVLPNQNIAYCGNKTVKLVPSLVGADFQYLWHPGGATTPVVEVDDPGLYTVEVTKAGGCALFDTIDVVAMPAPELALDAVQPSCDGKNDGSITTLVNSGEPVRYKWNTQDTSAMLTGLPSGTFTVTVTGVNSGCSASANQQLTQAVSVHADAEMLRLPLCENWANGKASVKASSGTPPYAYHWSTGSALDTTTLLAGGRFRVTVTDSEGCQAVDSIWVDPLRGIPETTGNICFDGKDGSITINAFGGFAPYQYALGSAGTFQAEKLFGDLATGPYSIRVKDNSGCIRSFPAEVKNLRPEPFRVSLVADSSVLLGEYVDVSIASNYPLRSYDWKSDCTGDQPNGPVLTLQPLKDCRIGLEALDTFGCPAAASILLKVRKDYHLYIPNVVMPAGGYDNSQFYASVFINQLKKVHVFRIFDRWGSMVFEDFDYQPNLVERGWDGTDHGRAAAPGVYVYVMDIEFIDGFRKVFTGDVTVVR